MQQGASTSKQRGANTLEVTLGQLSPGDRYPEQAYYAGRVVSMRPFHQQNKQAGILLAPLDDAPPTARRMGVEMKGAWARRAEQVFIVDCKVKLLVKDGKLVEQNKKNGQQQPVEWKEHKMLYKQGLQGAVWNEATEEWDEVHFKENDPENKTPAPQPLAELESSPPEQQQEAPLQQPPPPPVAVVAPKPNLALTFVRNVSPRKPSAEAPPPPARPPSTKRSSTSPAPVSVAQPKVIAEGTRKASTLESAPAIAEPSTLSPSKAKENAIIATDTPAVVSKKRKASEEGQGKRSAKKQRNWETPLTIKREATNPAYIQKIGKEIAYTTLFKLERDVNKPAKHVICVVAGHLPVKTTSTGEWNVSLKLIDATKFDMSTDCQLFGLTQNDVPSVASGDVVLLQNLNWNKDRKWFVGYKDKMRFVVLPRARLLDDSPVTSMPPVPLHKLASWGQEELEYARSLAHYMEKAAPSAASVGDASAAETTRSAIEISDSLRRQAALKRLTLLIEDIVPERFCDAVAEVVRIYRNGHLSLQNLQEKDSVILFVTDYTVNPLLFETENDKVVGQRVLQVSVFGDQAQAVEKLKQYDQVYLRNLRPKLNEHNLLECTIYPDTKYKGKKDITHLKRKGDFEEQIAAIKARREAYNALDLEKRSAEHDVQTLNTVVCSPKLLQLLETGPGEMASALKVPLEGIHPFRGQVVHYHPPRFDDWVQAYCGTCEENLPKGQVKCLDHDVDPYYCLWAIIRVRDESLGPEDEGLPILMRNGADGHDGLLPGLKLTPDMRNPDDSSADAIRQRFAPIFGTLESQKKGGKAIEVDTKVFDFALEAKKNEEGEMQWFFADGMEFKAPT